MPSYGNVLPPVSVGFGDSAAVIASTDAVFPAPFKSAQVALAPAFSSGKVRAAVEIVWSAAPGAISVQLQTADTDPTATLEVSRGLAMAGKESDAFERCAMMCSDAQRGQVFPRVGHQTLAASLVDGRSKGVGDYYIQTLLPQRDGGCETCGTASDDECIAAHCFTTPRATSPSRIPAPWRQGCCANRA